MKKRSSAEGTLPSEAVIYIAHEYLGWQRQVLLILGDMYEVIFLCQFYSR